MESQKKIALLIDAENVSQKYMKLIMNEINKYGVVTYKRVYGDFTNPSVSTWKSNLVDYAMTPVFQFNYTKGKNASDSAMVIDAMDILYSGKVSGFCLVTSDSDFTKLAIRLREAGNLVVGMGEKKTPNSLVAACETFKYLDLLYSEEMAVEREDAISKDTNDFISTPENVPVKSNNEETKDNTVDENDNTIPDREIVEAEIKSIIESISDEDEWIFLGTLGNMLLKRIPGFDPRNYGYKKLKPFIDSFECFETQETSNPKNDITKLVYVKVK